MGWLERIFSCERCGLADCPHLESSKMQAVCFEGSDTMSNYRAAETICQDCTEYLPRDAVKVTFPS